MVIGDFNDWFLAGLGALSIVADVARTDAFRNIPVGISAVAARSHFLPAGSTRWFTVSSTVRRARCPDHLPIIVDLRLPGAVQGVGDVITVGRSEAKADAELG